MPHQLVGTELHVLQYVLTNPQFDLNFCITKCIPNLQNGGDVGACIVTSSMIQASNEPHSAYSQHVQLWLMTFAAEMLQRLLIVGGALSRYQQAGFFGQLFSLRHDQQKKSRSANRQHKFDAACQYSRDGETRRQLGPDT